MDIKVLSEGRVYGFTVRTTMIACRLVLTSFSDGKMNWSSYSEQCKPVEKQTSIEIPDDVAKQAKQQLLEALTVEKLI